MIAIYKDLNQIPISLTIVGNNNIETAFNANIEADEFVAGLEYYKGRNNEVQEQLILLYHNKCAYCESKLVATYQEIEHYRPKKHPRSQQFHHEGGYYWLAYSWDNLLLACRVCNNQKSARFPVLKQFNYQGEAFSAIHTASNFYNTNEHPFIINPENETPESLQQLLVFDLNTGKIIAKNNNIRATATIQICDLNRIELIQSRKSILNDVKFSIAARILRNHNHPQNLIRSLKELKEDLLNKAEPHQEFSAWNRIIINNFYNIIKAVNRAKEI